MAILAAILGVTIVLVGLVMAGGAPSDARLGIEITCFVGGLVLCFLAVVLARLARLGSSLAMLREAQAPTTVIPDPSEDP